MYGKNIDFLSKGNDYRSILVEFIDAVHTVRCYKVNEEEKAFNSDRVDFLNRFYVWTQERSEFIEALNGIFNENRSLWETDIENVFPRVEKFIYMAYDVMERNYNKDKPIYDMDRIRWDITCMAESEDDEKGLVCMAKYIIAKMRQEVFYDDNKLIGLSLYQIISNNDKSMAELKRIFRGDCKDKDYSVFLPGCKAYEVTSATYGGAYITNFMVGYNIKVESVSKTQIFTDHGMWEIKNGVPMREMMGGHQSILFPSEENFKRFICSQQEKHRDEDFYRKMDVPFFDLENEYKKAIEG